MSSRFIGILLFVIIIGSYFPLQTLFFAVSAGMVLFLIVFRKVLQRKPFHMLWLGIPTILSTIIGLSTFKIFNVVKDIYYFSVPLLLFLFGGLLATKVRFNSFLRIIVISGFVVSIIRVVISASFAGFSAFLNPYEARYAIVGIVGNPAPVIGLAILLFSKKLGFKLFNSSLFNLLFVVNLLGIYMFASRTYYILLLCFAFFYIADKFKTIYLIPISAFTGLVFLFVLNESGSTSGNSSNVFIDKFFKSFTELSINKFQTAEDINTMYRGYESYMALKAFQEGKTINWIFGGLGKLVDLESDVLGEGLRNIPILHNGWIYIMLKTGILGLLFYILFLLQMFRRGWNFYRVKNMPPHIRFNLALFLGCITGLVITNYVVISLFNVEMTVMLICLGYCYVFGFTLIDSIEKKDRWEPK